MLLLPHKQKIDIFSEIERLVPESHETVTFSSVVDELTRISKTRGEDSIAARVGLLLLKEKKSKIIETRQSVPSKVQSIHPADKGQIACVKIRPIHGAVFYTGKNTDDAIKKFALENKPAVIVCTNDRLLRNSLRKEGVRIIGVREKNRLGFI